MSTAPTHSALLIVYTANFLDFSQVKREEILYEREQAKREEENKQTLKRAAENVQSVARTGSSRRQTGSQAERQRAITSMMQDKQRSSDKRERARRERAGGEASDDQDHRESSDEDDEEEFDEDEEEEDDVHGRMQRRGDAAKAAVRKRKRGTSEGGEQISESSDEEQDDEVEEEEDQDAEVTYKEFCKMCVSRNTLAAWVETPKLEETFMYMYVKFDATPQGSEVTYRIGQILGFRQSKKPYKLNHKACYTYLKLQRDSGIMFRYDISHVSSKVPSEEEFNTFISKIKESNAHFDRGEKKESETQAKLNIPKKRDYNDAARRLAKLSSYRFTESDIKKMVQNKRSVSASAQEKERLRFEEQSLLQQLEEGDGTLDEEKQHQLQKELERKQVQRQKIESKLEEKEERKKQIAGNQGGTADDEKALPGMGKGKQRRARGLIQNVSKQRLGPSTTSTPASQAVQSQSSHETPTQLRPEPAAEQGISTAYAMDTPNEAGTGSVSTGAGKSAGEAESRDQSDAAKQRASAAHKDRTEELLELYKQAWQQPPAPSMVHPETGERLSMNDAVAGKLTPIPRRPKPAKSQKEESHLTTRVRNQFVQPAMNVKS